MKAFHGASVRQIWASSVACHARGGASHLSTPGGSPRSKIFIFFIFPLCASQILCHASYSAILCVLTRFTVANVHFIVCVIFRRSCAIKDESTVVMVLLIYFLGYCTIPCRLSFPHKDYCLVSLDVLPFLCFFVLAVFFLSGVGFTTLTRENRTQATEIPFSRIILIH